MSKNSPFKFRVELGSIVVHAALFGGAFPFRGVFGPDALGDRNADHFLIFTSLDHRGNEDWGGRTGKRTHEFSRRYPRFAIRP